MHIVLDRAAGGRITATEISEDEQVQPQTHELEAAALPAFVAERERVGTTNETVGAPSTAGAGTSAGDSTGTVRWVWDSTALWYPALLAEGVRIGRCVDLALCHAILKSSALTLGSALASSDDERWSALAPTQKQDDEGTLFTLDAGPGEAERVDPVHELRMQWAAVSGATDPGRIRLLLAAESAGALIAAEMRFAGLPWRIDVHDRLLTRLLGPRVRHGVRPEKLERLAAQIREALESPDVNPDSQAELLRALRRAGLVVESTRAWELRELTHPVIAPLLEYKKLSRLLAANGWSWMDAWIVDGRFHPDYVPGGVVTGRWATRGGGALQLPKQVRAAVVADPGWKLVVADAGQLEPRILAALSADTAMAAAGRGHDLYDGIVASGAVSTRHQAKVAMLGAMYGATTGDSARLTPRLARAYPRAIALVEDAARAGERGDVVSTWLGRSSPLPGERWHTIQAKAYAPDASPADERNARSQARDWGRFTRNFVVQGSAAEWALCWMAELRNRLAALDVPDSAAATAPEPFAQHPHLVFFLHDEVIVHAPAALAERVAGEIREAAAAAGRLLYGTFPVEFALSAAIVDNYAQAKDEAKGFS